jgi:TolA-binding protein
MRCPTAHCVAAFVLLCLAAATLAGCGRSSMVGRRADDFSAYYNKFYNARKAFGKATDKLDDLERPVDRSAFLPVFVGPARAGSEEDFERATQKSADLLRKHPRSKWVDDALLLIGKSYFYQENHVGAEQKFREVIERGSPLSAEARFWVGRALLASGDWAAAEEHFRRHLGNPDSTESGRWAAQMRLLWGDLRVRRGQWESGARTLAEGLRGVRDGQTRARAFFLRGQALAAAGRWGDAARSYRSAAEERPRYELAYAAEASALRAAARAERSDVASVLRRLENMEGNAKNKAKRSELALLRGRIYQARGRSGQARRAYRALLYPGDEPTGAGPPSAKVRGRAHYALATLYRDAYDDFTRAAAHFDSAATALPEGGGRSPAEAGSEATPTAYAVTDSRRQAERYGRVADAAAEVARLDSLLRLGEMSADDFEAFVDSVRQARTQAAREAQERQARRRAERGFRERGTAGQDRRGDDGDAAGSGAGGASLASQASGSGADAGFLFHRDPAQVAEGRRVFRRRWGDRPRVPNWRRRAAISTQAEQEARGDSSDPTGPDADVTADGRPRVDVSAVPRNTERLRQMRTERAAARYDLGNALLLATARPDSAAFWFQRVLEENAGTEAARRARYALAEAERAAGRPEAARAQYRRVVKEQPGTRRARRAKRRLAEQQQQQRQQALDSSDGGARAEQAYARAYRTWQRGRRETALQQMIDLVASRPQAPVAPQALLAGARIFAEWAAREDRSLTAPLPARPPDSLSAWLTAPVGTADSTQQASPPAPSGEEAPPLTLARLLKGLERRYSGTPYADRAQAMQAALRETAPAPEEMTAAATPREAPDSSAAAAARDTTASREGGAWGIVVAREAERTRADSTAARLRARRRRALVRVLPATPRGAAGYRVVLGAFPTRAEAQAALRRRRATLPDSSRLEAVPPKPTAAGE